MEERYSVFWLFAGVAICFVMTRSAASAADEVVK